MRYALVLFGDGDARVYTNVSITKERLANSGFGDAVVVPGDNKESLLQMAKLARDHEKWAHDSNVDMTGSYPRRL